MDDRRWPILGAKEYLLNQSTVRCHASFAAASSYLGVVSLWNP